MALQLEPILGILITTMPRRDDLFGRLMSVLEKQTVGNDAVKVLSYRTPAEDEEGGFPTGHKRNVLLERAKECGCEYVAFVDDDDLVAADYVDRILEAIGAGKQRYAGGADVIGIRGIQIIDGHDKSNFVHSVRYRKRFFHKGVAYRPPTHLNPVKLEIAMKVRFPRVSWGEDSRYSLDVQKYLLNEVHIENPPIYIYEKRSRVKGWR